MNSIQLTWRHKKKLLKMCEELFPQYNRFIGFYKTEDEIFYKEKIYKFNLLHLIGDEDIQIIHWFEFTMSYLQSAINNIYVEKYIKSAERIAFEANNYPEGLPSNWLEIWEQRPLIQIWSKYNSGYPKQHPVDYLYEQFLKLK